MGKLLYLEVYICMYIVVVLDATESLKNVYLKWGNGMLLLSGALRTFALRVIAWLNSVLCICYRLYL